MSNKSASKAPPVGGAHAAIALVAAGFDCREVPEVYDPLVAKIEAVLEHRWMLVAACWRFNTLRTRSASSRSAGA
ncbi:MAG: hypothetical protein WD377_08775 [Nitriliruptoraceae bacterium]